MINKGNLNTIINIIGVIFSIKSLKKTIEEEYKGANIISFLFPFVGLIIYAVNIGKNDKLAKSCVKAALSGVSFTICLIIAVMLSLYSAYAFAVNSVVEIDSASPIINKGETSNFTSLDEIKKSLLKNYSVKNCNIDTAGKAIRIDITFYDNIDISEAKDIANSIFKNRLDYNYDYTVFLKINEKDYIGYHDGLQNSYIKWAD